MKLVLMNDKELDAVAGGARRPMPQPAPQPHPAQPHPVPRPH